MSTQKALVVAAFLLQTLLVFAGNSRLFGLVQPGSGWYTNREMSSRYTSLIQPARWALRIWALIYVWEAAAMIYLAISPPALAFWRSTSPTALWIAANAFQGMWALFFATDRLLLAALSLAGIAVALLWLGFSLRASSGFEYALIAAPIWLHAGWAAGASIINVNMVLSLFTSAATQLAVANASAFAACAIGLGAVYFTAADGSSWSPLIASPLAASLCWALSAIASELREPFRSSNSAGYVELGDAGRPALQMLVAGCAAVLGVGSAAIMVTITVAGAGQQQQQQFQLALH